MTEYINLRQYAATQGIQYRAAWNRFKQGRIEGAYQADSGRILVPNPFVKEQVLQGAVVYARVSSHKQKDDLERQAERMVEFANARGLEVIAVVKEVASGVNDERPKLSKLLERDDWATLAVEHKDRLSRVGFNWFDVLLRQQSRDILVANRAEGDKSDLMDDFASIIYSFAARLYGKRGRNIGTKMQAVLTE